MIWLAVILGVGSLVFLGLARLAPPEVGRGPIYLSRGLALVAILLAAVSTLTKIGRAHV